MEEEKEEGSIQDKRNIILAFIEQKTKNQVKKAETSATRDLKIKV